MTGQDSGRSENPDSETTASTFEEIMALDERGGVDSLTAWLAIIRQAMKRGEPAAGTHLGLFRRLTEIARANADPSEKIGVEALIAEGEFIINSEVKRQRGAERGIGFLRDFHERLGSSLAKHKPEPRPPSFLDIRDLIALESDIYFWSNPEEDCRKWLVRGLTSVAAGKTTSHLDFAPLQLVPGNRIPEQVGNAIVLAGRRDDLRRIEEVIPPTLLHMLQAVPTPVFADFSVDAAAWRLAGSLGLTSGLIVPCARLYSQNAGPVDEFWRITAQAMFDSVLRCPPTALQSEFFSWLKRSYPARWSPLLDQLLNEARAAELLSRPTQSPANMSENLPEVAEQKRTPTGSAENEQFYLAVRTAHNTVEECIPELIPQ